MSFPICVVLSPASAPSVLAQVMSAGKPEYFEGAAVVILQRHAMGESLDSLAECLEELSGRTLMRISSGTVSLRPGSICLIGENAGYRIEGEVLAAKPGPFELDAFLSSLANLGNRVTLVLLPGRDLPLEKMEVWLSLTAKGAGLTAATENPDPDGWALQLEASGVKVARRPLSSLFMPLRFSGIPGQN